MPVDPVEVSNEVEAIVGGYHGDAFRILGPHLVSEVSNTLIEWEVRAFLPQAQKVDVVEGGKVTPMTKVHKEGFYTAKFDHEIHHYLFRIHDYSGNALEVDDPYRFPPILTDF